MHIFPAMGDTILIFTRRAFRFFYRHGWSAKNVKKHIFYTTILNKMVPIRVFFALTQKGV